MEVYLHLGNSQTGEVGWAGPFEWVQLTYNDVIRVPEDYECGWFRNGLWEMEDGSTWTDVTVSTNVPEAAIEGVGFSVEAKA